MNGQNRFLLGSARLWMPVLAACAVLPAVVGFARTAVAAEPAPTQTAAPPAAANEEPAAPPASTPVDSLAAADPDSGGVNPLPERVRLEFYPDSLDTDDGARSERTIRIRTKHRRNRSHFGRVDVEPWLRYNRVEGLALYARAKADLPRHDYLPAYHAEMGYGFSSRRGSYRLGFEQPVAPRNKITLGAEAYRSVLSFFYGDEVIGDGENSASAFFLHRDYRDWYEAEGGRVFVGLHTSPFFSLTAGITSREENSLANETDWSLFRQENDFRINPFIAEGDYRAFDATLAYDTRPVRDGEWGGRRSRRGWGGLEHYHRLSWERADAGLGGDFDLWQVTADLRNYFRLSPRQWLSTRLLAGMGEAQGGPLPAQRRFALGGLSTLRGHGFRSLTGDRVALANLQYAFVVSRQSQALVFVDAGTAWDRGDLTDQRIPVDVGVGYRLGDEGITLLVGQNVNSSISETKVFLRFQEDF